MVQKALLKYLIFLIFSVTACWAQSALTATKVASIDTILSISFADVNEYVYEHYFDRLYRPPEKGYEAALQQIVLRHAKTIDFFAQGFHKNEILLQPLRRILNEELYNEYFRIHYYVKYINDTTILKTYDEMKRVVLYMIVKLQKKENESEQILDSLRMLATNIKQKLEQKVTLDSIRRSMPMALTFKNVSVDWDMSTTSPLAAYIFRLPVRTVTIVEDSLSISVIKILEIKKKNVDSLEKLKPKILSNLDLRYSYIAKKEFEKEQEKLLRTKAITWNRKALQQIVAWSATPNFYGGMYRDTIQHYLQRNRDVVLMKTPTTKITLQTFLYFLDEVLIFQLKEGIDEEELKKYLLEAAKIDTIAKRARAEGLEKVVFHPKTRNSVLVTEVAKVYDDEMIEKKLPIPTPDALQKFYESNKDSLYYQLAKSILYVAFSPDTSGIILFKKRIAEGTPFEKAAPRVFVRTFIRQRDGSIRPEPPADIPSLANIAFQLDLNEVVGPIQCTHPEDGTQYSLLKRVAKIEEKQLTYQDVQHSIKDDFKKYHRSRLASELENTLKEKYNITLDNEVLLQTLARLKAMKKGE